MCLSEQQVSTLNALCKEFRKDIIRLLHEKGTGHPGGSLSVCEILTVLYFAAAQTDPQNPNWEERDRIILSKGHAAPMLYRILAEKGFFPKEELSTLRSMDSRLQGHPCRKQTPGVELSTGPLGLGLSAGLGMALSLQLKGSDRFVYVVLGDGEINEGTIWEACMSAAKFKADHLIAILDWNGVQLDGTGEEIMPLGDVAAKFASFGWNCIPADGHDVASLAAALETAKQTKDKPSIVLAKTVKGKGVSFMEGKNSWHGGVIGDTEYALAMQELEVQ